MADLLPPIKMLLLPGAGRPAGESCRGARMTVARQGEEMLVAFPKLLLLLPATTSSSCSCRRPHPRAATAENVPNPQILASEEFSATLLYGQRLVGQQYCLLWAVVLATFSWASWMVVGLAAPRLRLPRLLLP